MKNASHTLDPNARRKPRARDLGLPFPGTPGPHNAITDVAGLLVGYRTLREVREGKPVNTGVTAILPRGRDNDPKPVWAGIHALNGNGEMTGSHWIRDGGYFVGPMMITNSHSVGMAHHAATRWMIDQYADAWQRTHLWAMPVVAETYDGVLNDIDGQHVTAEDARAAIDAADTGIPEEGCVGGGTGMIAYEFKGGTGTSSRLIEVDGRTYTIGALVQANHGLRPWLKVLGVPVGQAMPGDSLHNNKEKGSIIVVLATDAPMLPHQLQRLAKRAAIGIGQAGTPGGNNSGDIFIAFSTANPMPLPQLSGSHLSMQALNDECFDPLYMAAVEAVDEAVINAMVAAEDMPTFRPPGKVCRAIDTDRLVDLVSTALNLRNSA
ncbi:beta-peptidyl aminopeptidase [Marinobacterium lacunae]|uniref:Beta-peptidyl aminopeptidase n=1 Tax=Marinobacterium lacunae TaxID=1232683 RepID=A0A081FY90_9GAMM|nr:P1 family peptidase [Marinobacterium lacunae]KEA63495.1 beta-peptidyl aminopeptidase [Marinobacterium lacunae]MBR9883953.1 P1 family peptidase [Oceanospirillales bacterium]